jgi:hypothetical protein
MGIDYSAKLVWGIKFTKPKVKKNATDDEEDAHEELWDDIEEYWDWKTNQKDKTGVSVECVDFCYDGIEQNGDAGHFMFPIELSFETPDYGYMEIKIPQFDEAEMAEKLKGVCKTLGVKFTKPGWHLMTHGM